jgi:hypothetical protein
VCFCVCVYVSLGLRCACFCVKFHTSTFFTHRNFINRVSRFSSTAIFVAGPVSKFCCVGCCLSSKMVVRYTNLQPAAILLLHTHTQTNKNFISFNMMATSASAPPKSRYCWLLDAVCSAPVYRQMCVIEVSVLCGLLGFEYVSCCELLECVLTVGLTVTCWQ